MMRRDSEVEEDEPPTATKEADIETKLKFAAFPGGNFNFKKVYSTGKYVEASKNPEPIVGYTRINLIDVCEINTKSQFFQARLYIEVMFALDEVCPDKELQGAYVQHLLSGRPIFHPRVHFGNLLEEVNTEDEWFEVTEGNADKTRTMIHYRRKLMCKLVERMYVNWYPFDVQDLQVTLRSDWPTDVMVLRPNHKAVSSAIIKTFTTNNVFGFSKYISVSQGATLGVKTTFSEVTFRIKAFRKPGVVIWNVFFPLFFISLLGLTAFTIPLTEPSSLNDRFEVSGAILLTLVAYKFATSSSLPDVNYLTLADFFVLGHLLTQVFLMLGSSLILQFDHPESYQRSDTIFSIVISSLFLSVNFGFMTISFVRYSRMNVYTKRSMQHLFLEHLVYRSVEAFLKNRNPKDYDQVELAMELWKREHWAEELQAKIAINSDCRYKLRYLRYKFLRDLAYPNASTDDLPEVSTDPYTSTYNTTCEESTHYKLNPQKWKTTLDGEHYIDEDEFREKEEEAFKLAEPFLKQRARQNEGNMKSKSRSQVVERTVYKVGMSILELANTLGIDSALPSLSESEKKVARLRGPQKLLARIGEWLIPLAILLLVVVGTIFSVTILFTLITIPTALLLYDVLHPAFSCAKRRVGEAKSSLPCINYSTNAMNARPYEGLQLVIDEESSKNLWVECLKLKKVEPAEPVVVTIDSHTRAQIAPGIVSTPSDSSIKSDSELLCFSPNSRSKLKILSTQRNS